MQPREKLGKGKASFSGDTIKITRAQQAQYNCQPNNIQGIVRSEKFDHGCGLQGNINRKTA
jgi:hypothetical protein